MERLTGIQTISVSQDGIFGSWRMATPSKNKNGEEILVSVCLYEETMNFLDFYNIHLFEPEQTRAMLHKTALPVVVNESFVRCLVPEGENPIGQLYNKYLKDDAACNEGIITGIFKDFKIASFSESSFPMRVILRELPNNKASVIAFK